MRSPGCWSDFLIPFQKLEKSKSIKMKTDYLQEIDEAAPDKKPCGGAYLIVAAFSGLCFFAGFMLGVIAAGGAQ